ncbi:putative Blumeria specific protein/putative protein required for hyphal anastomosis [Blumeria hordei DH14]|uniref:Far11/STRP N-terminal domain-containing protein n=1 Tax=Blumeria graminis f. sp. hordei (strain DH14) TaxID=546991 RepID=N1JFF5_BLUG1|nr:putative Blumeria specific protein/putative protein required for hyphal anastomosis [Blumeria hordei DH14]
MHSLYSSRQSSNRRTVHEAQDVADTGIAVTVLPAPLQSFPTSRSQLTLNQNNPQAPLPQSTFSNVDNTKDDISLPQLRRIVAEIPKTEAIPYAFTYADTASFEDEINEWFSYSDAEYKRLIHAKDIFQARWKKFGSKPWTLSDESVCEKFVKKEISELQTSSSNRRWKSLQTILHIVLGVWDVTACIDSKNDHRVSQAKASSKQISQMKFGLNLVARAGGVPILFNILQNVFQIRKNISFQDSAFSIEKFPYIQNELNAITSIFYLLIEGIRYDNSGLVTARKDLFKSSPNLVSYLIDVTASLRWDEASILPQKKVFLLLWKSILLALGGTAELNNVKKDTKEDQNSGDEGEKLITASPLDYHIFRQEIISKYPAYTPPQPLIPLEPENNSILPPLFSRPQITNRTNAGIITSAIDVNSSGASILHQPVHIATPAPSPPPSPPVGGKAGKKQNYQTNQNFPFIYPPLDSSSNSAGGKGLAGLQELIVGRKWKGSDIPKSILEAGDFIFKANAYEGWDDEEDPFDFGDSDPETAIEK